MVEINDTDILRNIHIFDSLSDNELWKILESPTNGIEEFSAKDVIIREQEIGDCMYVVLDGAVEVLVKSEAGRDISVNTLRKGDFFGEQSLLPGGSDRRNATIRSVTNSTLFKIAKHHVSLCVDGAEEEENFAITLSDLETQRDEVQDLLASMRLFKTIKEIELNAYRSWTEVIEIAQGETLLNEDEEADSLYVVLEGEIEIFTKNDDKHVALARLNVGNYFGEQALLPGNEGKRNAHAKAIVPARLIKVSKNYFRLVLNRDEVVANALDKVGDAQEKVKAQAKSKKS